MKLSKGKKLLLIGGAVAVALALVILFALSSPLALVSTGVQNSMAALQKNETAAYINSVLNGGSTEVTCSLSDPSRNLLGISLFDGEAGIKLYTNLEESAMAATVDVRLNGKSSLDLRVQRDQNALIVSSDRLLQGKAYGIDLAGAGESIGKDTQKAQKAMATKLLGSLRKHADVRKKGAKLTFNADTVKTTAVTVQLNSKQMAAVLQELVTFLRTDQDMQQYLTDHMADMIFASKRHLIQPDEVQSYIQDFYTDLEELAARIEDSAFSMTLTFHITKSGKQLVGLELESDWDQRHIDGYVYAGPDLSKPAQIHFRMDMAGKVTEGSLAVQTNDSKQYAAEVRYIRANAELLDGKITWDKKNGDLNCSMDLRGKPMEMEAQMLMSGKKVVMTLHSITRDGATKKPEVVFALNGADKMPAMPDYENVLDMTDTQLQTIVQNMAGIAKMLLQFR